MMVVVVVATHVLPTRDSDLGGRVECAEAVNGEFCQPEHLKNPQPETP